MVVVVIGVGSCTCKLTQLFEKINAIPHSNSFCILFSHSLSYLTHSLSLSTNFLLSLTLNVHSASSLTLILHSHSPYPLFPLTSSHTISLLTISHPPQLHFLDSLLTLIFPHGGPLICRWFSSSMWEVLFSTTSHIPSKINSFENLLSLCLIRFSNQYCIASNP